MTPELRKMAEDHVSVLYQQAFDATIKDRPTYRMIDCYVEFARLVAEDCAKLCELHQNTEGDCIAGQIREKYAP